MDSDNMRNLIKENHDLKTLDKTVAVFHTIGLLSSTVFSTLFVEII